MKKPNVPGLEPKAPKKSKRKLILGATAASLLLVAIVFGATTNFFGAMNLNLTQDSNTKKVATKLDTTIDLKTQETTSVEAIEYDFTIQNYKQTGDEEIQVTICNNSEEGATIENGDLQIYYGMNDLWEIDTATTTPNKSGSCENITKTIDIDFFELKPDTSYDLHLSVSSTEKYENEDLKNDNALDETFTTGHWKESASTGDEVASETNTNTASSSSYDLEVSDGYFSDSDRVAVQICNNSDLGSTIESGEIYINYSMNNEEVETTPTIPSSGDCSYTNYPVASYFGDLDENETYEMTITIDSTEVLDETNESNNTTTVTYGEEETDSTIGIVGTINIESDKDDTTKDPSEETNGIEQEENDLTVGTLPLDNEDSKDLTVVETLEYGEEIEVKDYDDDAYTYTEDENNDDTSTAVGQEGPGTLVGASDEDRETNQWSEKYTVILMRIGDLTADMDNSYETNYEGSIESDTTLIKPITPVLFEDQQNDIYSELTPTGVEWINYIYDHWDGIVFLSYYDPEHANYQPPSFTVTVDGYLNKVIDSREDLETVYDLNDGTDNQVDFMLIQEYESIQSINDYEGGGAETEAEAAKDWLTLRMDEFVNVLETANENVDEDTTDEETYEALDSLVTTVITIATDEDITDEKAEEAAEETEKAVEEAVEDGQMSADEIDTATNEADAEALDGYDAGYTDVDGTWYEDYANEAGYYGITDEDGSFNGADVVNRAVILKMTISAFYGGETVTGADAGFIDVNDEWFAPYVNSAAEYGLISTDSDYYRPTDPVNRAEVLKILMLASQLETRPSAEYIIGTPDVWYNPFSDVRDYDWFYTYVMEALYADIISENTTYRPGENVNRAEATKIIIEIMDILRTPSV